MRVFLAADISKAAERRLAKIQTQLKREENSVNWVRPNLFHLTIFFLGDLREEAVKRVGERLAGDLADFSFSAFKTSSGGSLRLVGDLEAFSLLRHRAKLAIEAVLPDLDKKFLGGKRPHLTLGRVRGGGRLLRGRGVSAARRRVEFKVKRLVLYRSRLSPGAQVIFL